MGVAGEARRSAKEVTSHQPSASLASSLLGASSGSFSPHYVLTLSCRAPALSLCYRPSLSLSFSESKLGPISQALASPSRDASCSAMSARALAISCATSLSPHGLPIVRYVQRRCSMTTRCGTGHRIGVQNGPKYVAQGCGTGLVRSGTMWLELLSL